MNLIIGAFLMSGMTILVALMFRDSILSLLNLDALLIVLGGSLCAAFIGFPLSKIRCAAVHVTETFRDHRERVALVGKITGVARTLRKADIRAAERQIENINDDFLRFGLDLLVNNTREEDIRQSMEREMALRMVQYHSSQNVLRTMARLTPAFGLVGTVLSLIRMFGSVQSFDGLAPHMAGALMSTLYGVVISNLFMLPLSARVADRAVVSEIHMNMALEGVLAIHNQEHPMKIEEKLQGFIRTGGARATNDGAALAVKRA